MVALKTIPPNFPKPASACSPNTQIPSVWMSGGQSVDRAEDALCIPLSQPELCENETAGLGQRPNPDTNEFSRSHSSDAEGSVKKQTIPEISKGY